MTYSIYAILWLFVIYAFLGWCTEVAYAAVNHGKFVNRGFLNGPVCPIYGTGAVAVILTLTPIKDNLFILFLGAVLMTTAIEWATGFVLKKLFHDRWWDYSDIPFNIGGYVCLKFSLLWGMGCVAIMEFVQPLIYDLVKMVPYTSGMILLCILLILFAVDAVVTVMAINNLNRRLRFMDEISGQLREFSDSIGENISDGVIGFMDYTEDVKEKMDEGKAKVGDTLAALDETKTSLEEWMADLAEQKDAISEKVSKSAKIPALEEMRVAFEEKCAELGQSIDEIREAWGRYLEEKQTETREKYKRILQAKYSSLLEEKRFGQKRLMDAFPGMKSEKYDEMLKDLKSHWKKD